MICVFDIETVPDVPLIKEHYALESMGDIEVCEYAFNAQKEKTNSEFLPIFWHRVIAISCVFCDDYGHFKKVGSFGNDEDKEADEEMLLKEFLTYLNAKEPRLVSFNGRGFDLPTIMLRAMRYNLSAFGYFDGNSNPQKNKFENYRNRYSERWHTDLLESLGHFGSVRNLRLDSVCKMLGFVGKYDVSGEDVFRLYFEEKNIAKINEYCQSDVLNTYWVYLKYAILRGELNVGDYGVILEEWKEKLPKNKGFSEVFIESIQGEINRLKV